MLRESLNTQTESLKNTTDMIFSEKKSIMRSFKYVNQEIIGLKSTIFKVKRKTLYIFYIFIVTE